VSGGKRFLDQWSQDIQRHSESPKAQIRIDADSNQISLEVRHEGVGLELPSEKEGGADTPKLGVGLAGMSERIQELGESCRSLLEVGEPR
jgi:signal transduction histidine kinase